MELVEYTVMQNREQAGKMLSTKLNIYKNDNAIVVGIPRGGVCVAAAIAESLELPLEVMSCRKIKHPADSTRTIGSVSINETAIHDCTYDIPQDYLCHQVILLRHSIQLEHKKYYAEHQPASLLYKTVILVDDVLKSVDTIMACIQSIKAQKPLKIVVAIPLVSAETARLIRAEVDDMIFLQMKNLISSGKDHFVDFPVIEEEMVRDLLNHSKSSLVSAC
jgi:putative phosphoribosyl transferase